jgi:hypothetical protein
MNVRVVESRTVDRSDEGDFRNKGPVLKVPEDYSVEEFCSCGIEPVNTVVK